MLIAALRCLFANDIDILAKEPAKKMIQQLTRRYDVAIVKLDPFRVQIALFIAAQFKHKCCDKSEGIDIPALMDDQAARPTQLFQLPSSIPAEMLYFDVEACPKAAKCRDVDK